MLFYPLTYIIRGSEPSYLNFVGLCLSFYKMTLFCLLLRVMPWMSRSRPAKAPKFILETMGDLWRGECSKAIELKFDAIPWGGYVVSASLYWGLVFTRSLFNADFVFLISTEIFIPWLSFLLLNFPPPPWGLNIFFPFYFSYLSSGLLLLIKLIFAFGPAGSKLNLLRRLILTLGDSLLYASLSLMTIKSLEASNWRAFP